jgi:hypothetical protein
MRGVGSKGEKGQMRRVGDKGERGLWWNRGLEEEEEGK